MFASDEINQVVGINYLKKDGLVIQNRCFMIESLFPSTYNGEFQSEVLLAYLTSKLVGELREGKIFASDAKNEIQILS